MMKTKPIILAVFSLGALMFVLGQIISFVPGAETTWFLATVAMLTSGLFIKSNLWRIVTSLFIIVALTAAITGHKRGTEYRE